MAVNKKKSNTPLMIGAAAILCIALVVILISKNDKQNEAADTPIAAAANSGDTASDAGTADDETSNNAEDNVQTIAAGGSLVIPISEISSTVQFYPIEVDGTRMEVLAVKDSEGTIRTAFNTCQICYGSGRGYYVQEGDVLVCQNCGNRFTIDQIEVEVGGCNPWPIFPENKTVTEDTIEISYDFLQESEKLFTNWKMSY